MDTHHAHRRPLVAVRIEPRLVAEVLVRALAASGVDTLLAVDAHTRHAAQVGVVGAGLSHNIEASAVLELDERGTAVRLVGSDRSWLLDCRAPTEHLVVIVSLLIEGEL